MAGGALSFREDPFRLTPDRRYIFETDGFRRAFAMLLAGVRARRGAMLLTGPSGTGKTTLLQGLLAKLQQDGAVVFWRFHPDIPGYDLIGSCLAELEVTDVATDLAGRARALTSALKGRAAAQPAVLIVDEAGQFADAQLAELGTLPTATGGAVQVILAGLPTLVERLEAEPLAGLRRAIALRAELGPLARNELGAYIAHRCRVAGQAGPLVFEPSAITHVFDHTSGVPRLVNRLCATALFFADPESKRVSAAVVDEAARACAHEETAPARTGLPAVVEPEPAAATEPSPETPDRPRPREVPSEVHRTLAEAERAWIAGSTAASGALTPASEPPPAVPAVSDWHVTEAAAETGEDQAPPEFSPMPVDVSKPAPRRSPALRIAASIVVVAGAAAAAGMFLWPSGTNHERRADSQPTQATARLLAAEEAPSTAPNPPAEASPQIGSSGVPIVAALIPVAPASASVDPPPAAEPSKPAIAAAAVLPPVTALPETALAAAPEPLADMTIRPEPAHEEPAPAPTSGLSEIEPASGPAAAAEPEPIVEAAAILSPVEATKADPTPMVIAAPAPPKAEPEPLVMAAPAPPKAEPTPVVVAAAATPKAEPTPAIVAAPAQSSAPVAAALDAPASVAALVPAESPSPASRTAKASLPPADAAELRRLMARGDEMLRLGDPASARLFYERAAAQGLASAYTAVGQTYDPALLQRLGIRWGGANGEQALAWYRRGADAGDGAATRAINELSAWLARPR